MCHRKCSRTVLMIPCAVPQVMPLLFMLQQPLAVDEKDTDGHTALMWAAYQGIHHAFQSTQSFNGSNWSPNFATTYFASLVFLSSFSGDAISVDLLLRHSASVHTKDNTGMTPLHWSVVKGNKGTPLPTSSYLSSIISVILDPYSSSYVL